MILAATREELAAAGHEARGAEGSAQRANVGKSTRYPRWLLQQTLALATLHTVQAVQGTVPIADMGHLRHGVLTVVEQGGSAGRSARQWQSAHPDACGPRRPSRLQLFAKNARHTRLFAVLKLMLRQNIAYAREQYAVFPLLMIEEEVA